MIDELKEIIPERDHDDSAFNRLDGASLLMDRDGNMTTATFVSKNGEGFRTGVAKCNPKYDEYDHERGRRIAIIRAYRNLRDRGWLYVNSGEAVCLTCPEPH